MPDTMRRNTTSPAGELVRRPLTLIELLSARAQERPDERGYVYLEDGYREEASYTYAALDRRARAVAA